MFIVTLVTIKIVEKYLQVKSIVNMGPDELEDKTITLVIGTDFINTSFTNFCTHKVCIYKMIK